MMKVRERRFETFFQDPLYLLYKNHLYNYLARRHVIRRSLRGSRFKTILELGCGTSPMLDASAETIQTDVSWQALSVLKSASQNGKSLRPIACNATRLPFLDESFECVICSEVLEHIEQDQIVLQEIFRVMKPGGELILTCPLHQRYFGFDDHFVGHYRRYEAASLTQRLSEIGFKNHRSRPVLGPLEKQIMERVSQLFALFKGRKTEAAPPGVLMQVLALIFFPFYLCLNDLLAILTFGQAQIVPLEKVVTLCIRCQKAA